MNSEDIYNGITEIDEKYIALAESYRFSSSPQRVGRRAGFIIAAAALMAALTAIAYASGWFGLRDVYISTQMVGPAGSEYQADIISLQGVSESPEFMAAREWDQFLLNYDKDGAIIAQIGNSPTGFEEKYGAYLCYTQDMADMIDSICEKHNLRLLGNPTFPDTDEELFSLAGTGEFYKCQGDGQSGYIFENHIDSKYVMDDGSFMVSGTTQLSGDVWPYDIRFQFSRCMKGSFNPWTLNVRNIDDYEQWNYVTHDGTQLFLAQGSDKELIIAELEDSVVVINLLDVYIGDIERGDLHKSHQDLEAFADTFEFSEIP